MTRKFFPARHLSVAAIALMSLGLSACLPAKSQWSENDTIKRNSVSLHHITYDLTFKADETGLTDAQAGELDRFLGRSLAGYGDEFAMDTGSSDADASRREAIASYLRSQGLSVSTQPVVYGGAVGPNTVRLVLNRYVVTPPPCPDWRKPAGTDFNNQSSGNFGCATETNLGLMVANPRDLVAGRTIGPADGEQAAKAIENYRAGKVPEPTSVSTGSERRQRRQWEQQMSATASLSIDAGQELSREPFAAFVTDEDSRHALAPIIQERGWSGNRVQGGGVANAVRSLALSPSPQFLIVDLSDSENPRADISALAEVCEPGTIVIALGEINDVSLYRDLLATGIHDYLIKPITTEVLMDCMIAADNATKTMPIEEPVKAAGGKIIPIIGARGGVGGSTVAISMAWLAAHEFSRKVALLDLDIHYGTSTLAFDLEPGRGLCDALENPSRVDGLFIERAMVKESEKLSILGSEAALSEVITPDPAALAHLVQELRNNFSTVMIDLPRHMAAEHNFLLSDAQQIVIVTDLALPSMRDVIRLLALCKDVAPAVPVKLVCNKQTDNDEVTKADFEKAVERKFDWVIPMDRKSLVVAAKSGRPLPVAAKNSKPVGVLRRIAKDLTGEADSKAKKQGVLKKLFQGTRD